MTTDDHLLPMVDRELFDIQKKLEVVVGRSKTIANEIATIRGAA